MTLVILAVAVASLLVLFVGQLRSDLRTSFGYSAAEGKVAHSAMRSQAYFDEMIVRDCLGGTVMRKELKEMVDTA